jgi:transcriptional regulator with PAS, ATPase and Fis domain
VSKGSFVIVDCTVFGEELFESELFGHEKGAFTGATSSKKGLFESADNGTLFLDEIGELPLAQQAKLLRAMESGQFRRVGGTTTLKASVRVICATHRHLAEMVKQGRFREDLFYRLSVFPIEIPPLRVRKQDIPLLVDYFRQQLGDIRGCQFSMTDQALQKLMRHDWPGNIRELKNCLQLAVGLCQHNIVQEEDIHFMQVPSVNYVGEEDSRASRLANETISSGMTALEEYEANFIANLIEKYQGNRKLVAAEMNISERTLYRKLNRLNLT